jgi:penicillin V acylase-like amidase (Ntn superfamily)
VQAQQCKVLRTVKVPKAKVESESEKSSSTRTSTVNKAAAEQMTLMAASVSDDRDIAQS